MALHLGRSRQAVKARCHLLGVKREGVIEGLDGVAYRKWTPEEEKRLAALCGEVDLQEAAQLLGRTPGSIHQHSRELKLDWTRSHTFKCIRDVCKELGISRHRLLRIIKENELEVHTGRGNRTGVPPETIKRVKEEMAKPPKKRKRKVKKVEEAPAVQEEPVQVISTQGEAGKAFLRSRMIYARSLVFLETLKRGGVSVSVWEVMRKAQARKPWATAGDLEVVVEAALTVGMEVRKDGKDFIFC